MPVLYIQMYMYEDNLKLLPVLNIQMYMFEDNLKLLPGNHTDVYVFVCFVALRPKSTALVIAGRSVHLSTLFPGQA